MTVPQPVRQKIAILGGGVGAMTAAYALTESPGWSDRYEITVYQMGWRLGGKGASGRDAANGQRILEHGLHIWFGFYHNAFRMMQTAYRECLEKGLSPGSPLSTWEDAFKGQNLLSAMEWVDEEWRRWDMDFIVRPGVPGEGEATLGPWHYVKLMLGWMKDRVDQEQHPIRTLFDAAGDGIHLIEEEVRTLIVTAGAWFEQKEVHVEASFPAVGHGAAPDLHAAHALAERMPDDPSRQAPEHREALLELVHSFQRRLQLHREKSAEADRCRREWILFDIATAAVRGIVADNVLSRGFDAIDDLDGREWLARHGAHDVSYNSSMVRGMYDLVFAYERGDLHRAGFAAGTALRSTLRILFDYKGSVTYKMQAGMGDTVFSPLYLMLKSRGVKFAFFHKVINLGLSDDKTVVNSIAIDVQARPTEEYEPLVTVKGLPCWPSEPLYDQIEGGAGLKARLEAERTDLESGWCKEVAEKKVLKRGRDYDLVILGISLGGIKTIAPELIAASPAWRDLVDKVKTVETQAFQLWMTKDADELGWHGRERALVGAYVEPIDTWADMSQVLDKEEWPTADGVKNVSYLCAALACDEEPPLDDPTYPHRKAELVKRTALEFLRDDASILWPDAADPDNPSSLDWSVLVAPAGVAGPGRFDYQFWRANSDPSERYVLSLPGTTRYRFLPGDSGFANLYLAGDWTHNDINLGCVEAAAMSALMATRAISGYPEVIFGEDAIPSDCHAHP